jgi:hypothetical protein
MDHVDALYVILGTARYLTTGFRVFHLRYSSETFFSSVQRSELENMELLRKPLRLNDAALDARTSASPISPNRVEDLRKQIIRICRSTSKRVSHFGCFVYIEMNTYTQFEAGARVILDAVLLTIADISLDAQEKLPVAILPEMQIMPGHGVLVKNFQNQYKVWLSGNVDYGVCTYQREGDRGMEFAPNL